VSEEECEPTSSVPCFASIWWLAGWLMTMGFRGEGLVVQLDLAEDNG
jgi:hypothetical protein